MKGAKKEINFLAAQKILSRTGQTTSFEFMLVLATIVVAAAMVGWYMLSKKTCDGLGAKVAENKAELERQEQIKTDNENAWNNAYPRLDATGAQAKKMVGSREVLLWDSVVKRLEDTEKKLEGVRIADESIKGSINLTSACHRILYETASACGCSVTKFEYGDGTIKLTLSGERDSLSRFYLVLRGERPYPEACDPGRFVLNVNWVGEISEDAKAPGLYTGTMAMEVRSDRIYVTAGNTEGEG